MKATIAIIFALTILLLVPMGTLLNTLTLLTVLLGLIALLYIPVCMFSDNYKDWKWERKFKQWRKQRSNKTT